MTEPPEWGGGRADGAALPFLLSAFDCLDSTNDEARRRAEAGAAAGTVVWAGRQLAGRGRRGRSWSSPEGNLYCSLVLRPACPPALAAQLSLVTAVAVGAAVVGCLPPERVTRLKWPNDILIDGCKVAGILLETGADAEGRVTWLVVGVGINVRHFPADAGYPATSLLEAGLAGEGEVEVVLKSFLDQFGRWYRVWRDVGLEPVRAAWLARAAGLGTPISVRLHQETVSGRFAGLDLDGALLLASGEGGQVVRVTAGDVFFPGGVGGPATLSPLHP